jgi:hypothetical protein
MGKVEELIKALSEWNLSCKEPMEHSENCFSIPEYEGVLCTLAEKDVSFCDKAKEQIIRILKESEEVRECRFCKWNKPHGYLTTTFCENKKSFSYDRDVPDTFGCNFWEKKYE